MNSPLPASTPKIRVDGLTHSYGQLRVVNDVSFSVGEGDFVSIVGPSGGGKTTILKVLAGLLTPQQGSAHIGGRSTVGRPGFAAYMPQKDQLLPWRRALENATLGAEIRGLDRGESRDQARDLFPLFGLEGHERSWPGQLSGGMRQRLALLRTFLTGLDVLLLDEPFSALDALTRREMHRWLQDVWLADRRTVVMVTHDVEEALLLSDNVVVLSPRPAEITATITSPFVRPRSLSATGEPDFIAAKSAIFSALDHRPNSPKDPTRA